MGLKKLLRKILPKETRKKIKRILDNKHRAKKIVANNHYEIITLKKMCEMMQVEVPAALKHKQSAKISQVLLRTGKLRKGSAYIMVWDDVDIPLTLDLALSRGADFIFISREKFESCGLKEEDYPVILLDDELAQLGYFFSTIRKSYPATTVEITGTLGKTTAKQFLSTVVDSHYKSYCSTGNRNSFGAVAEQIRNHLFDDLDVYVQETGAAKPRSVEKSAVMLQPDIFIVLNVKDHHMESYGSYESLFNDKVSADKYMPEHGVIITNYDDENLANHQFMHKVISFGITTEKEVDYRAANIVEQNGKLDFDIISADETVHISTNILGAHNVYNALAAYIAGKQLEIPKEKIINAFASYQTEGIRQNYVDVGGYHLYMDCYNCAFTSITADLESLNSFTLEPGKKKIAVIGGENGLGAKSSLLHYNYGKTIGNYDVDYFYFLRPAERTQENLDLYGDPASIFDGMIDAGFTNCECLDSTDELIAKLKEHVEQGDLILFKGQLESDFTVVADKVFGTSFVPNLPYYRNTGKTVESDDFEFRLIPAVKALSLQSYEGSRSYVEIPDTVEKKPVYRIARKAFAGSNITKVSIGRNILNIGPSAFAGCKQLKKVVVPGNVKVLEAFAFSRCSNLEQVKLKDGVCHIGKKAFANCSELKQITIPESVKNIAPNAFDRCPELVIQCKTNSYAHEYAQKNDYQYAILL